MQAERGSEHKDALCYNSFTLPLGAQRRQGGGRTRLRGGQRQRERARRSKAKRGTSKLYDLRAQRSGRMNQRAGAKRSEARASFTTCERIKEKRPLGRVN